MSKRKYVLTASLGVIGALLISGTASAAVTGISYTATVSPKKQSNKTFGPASISNNIETFYSGGFLPTATETALVFSTDLKFTPGKLARCNLSQINTGPRSSGKRRLRRQPDRTRQRHHQRRSSDRKGGRLQRHPVREQSLGLSAR